MAHSYTEQPQVWLFNQEDRTKYAGRFWRCPARLVHDRTWAMLWREPGSVRGGGTVTSILPLLAIHSYPSEATSNEEWTPWKDLSHRRIARLAGINKDSVGPAQERLVEHGLLQLQTVAPPRGAGGKPRRQYRLHYTLFPQSKAERHVQIAANLFYGGVWSLLPSPAARHLYIVLAGLDPIVNEDRLAEHLYRDDPDMSEDGKIAQYRAKHSLSIAEIADYAGLQRSTTIEALGYLTQPLYDPNKTGRCTLALVDWGPSYTNGIRWYAPSRQATRWEWKAESLNPPGGAERLRKESWPSYPEQQRRRLLRTQAAKKKRVAQA